MTNNFTALRPKLMERFKYERSTGFFYHRKSAPPYHAAGERAEKRDGHALVLRHDGLHLAAKRVAWLFVTEAWPTGHLTHENGDPDDVRFENLVTVAEMSRKRKTRKCNHCGAEYVAHRVDGGAKYCSRGCVVAANGKPLPTEVPCKRCGVVLPIGEFPAQNKRIRLICTSCLRKHDRTRRLAKAYGLSVADFEALLVKFNHRCAICREAPETGPKVDHCHTTGAVRGILCTSCNTGLGQFGDSATRLRAAADYLECGE